MADNKEEESTWTSVLWSLVTMVIGFGFAVYRYLQYAGITGNGHVRLSRIERVIYRGTGMWGVIISFIIMGLLGLYFSYDHYKNMKRRRRL